MSPRDVIHGLCPRCYGGGALWNKHIGTWEPCGCGEDDDDGEERDDGPDPDDARDRRIDDELMGLDDRDIDFSGDD